MWTFNGQVPGPAINAVQGERIRVVVRNDLTEPATVHWHGLRVPNEMDGVPDLTQPAIEPGEAFVYEFDLRDAGTYWYHAFFNGAEQTERGLYGALIVDERQQAGADRDIVWILDDWSLDEHGRFRPFHDRMAASHAGRLGTMVTINGRMDHIEPVRAYERIRLRLVNAANARTFGLKFDNQKPWVMAFDGQPVPPHRPPGDRVVLAAGMRADLFIDIPDRHWSTVVIDDYFDGAHYAYDLARFTYSKTPPLRLAPLPEPTMLPANPIAEPNLADAERYQIVLDGGAAGVPETDLSSGEKLYGKETVGQELYWSINGRGQDELSSARPLARLQLDRSYRFELINRTIFEHAIYLHGHKFRVVAREGRPEPHRPFRDTVLVGPKENVEIAFVADNPGRWLLHCSVREHQETGMTAVLAVR
ncbi:MAG: multicopper oxidase family protein [Alphaproteobacteria bacterium]